MLFNAAIFFLATTVAETATWTDADYRTNRLAHLTGLTTAVNSGFFILDDDTGRTMLLTPGNILRPDVGDRVTVSCRAIFSEIRQKMLLLQQVTRLGSGPVPAPSDAAIPDILRGRQDYAFVRVSGEIVGISPDDIDRNNLFLILSDGSETILLSYNAHLEPPRLGSHVEVTGLVIPTFGGLRLFTERGLTPFGRSHADYLRIVRDPPDDLFSAPTLDSSFSVLPRNISALGRRRISGRVTAVWHGDHLMLDTGSGPAKVLPVELESGARLPAVGDVIDVVGFPRTDLFTVALVHACWRPSAQHLKDTSEPPLALTAHQLLTDMQGNRQIQARYHGHVIQLKGVVRNVPTTGLNENRIQLQDGDLVVPIDASSCPESFRDVLPGCKIKATGVCLLIADAWRPDSPVPSVHGFSLIIRSPDDILIISRPPWWTPARLLTALGILFAVTVFFIVWNRILGRIVIRRSRELAREQIARDAADLKVGERTRLAVELHDSLSQNLEGLACQVTALEGVLTEDPKTAREFLTTARQMLASCRAELRSCLFDLRGHALEASTFTEALRTTLKPFVAGQAVSVRFDVRTSLFPDSTVHAVLCIVRELVANAIRHGHAEHIRVAGECRRGVLRFSVEDDGGGFDTMSAPGVESGHFGLTGIRTRIERLGGTMNITSSHATGTYVRVTIQGERT